MKFLDLLFPPRCPFCRKFRMEEGTCGECEKALPFTEGKDILRKEKGGLVCAAPLWYEDLAREGILAFKFPYLFTGGIVDLRIHHVDFFIIHIQLPVAGGDHNRVVIKLMEAEEKTKTGTVFLTRMK